MTYNASDLSEASRQICFGGNKCTPVDILLAIHEWVDSAPEKLVSSSLSVFSGVYSDGFRLFVHRILASYIAYVPEA